MQAAKQAIQSLDGHQMRDGQKMYVKEFESKQDRRTNQMENKIKYKKSKQLCNLYVKNFPYSWTEQELTILFQNYGTIEQVKI